MPSLLVIGSGPGIASSTTALFAGKKFNRVALVSRSVDRIQQDKLTILDTIKAKQQGDVKINTWNADVNDSKALRKVLSEISEKYDDLTCVLFNAAKVAPSTLLEYSEEDIMDDFKTTNIALYVTAQWAVPILQTKKIEDKPSFLVTSSLLWKQPFPMFFGLSLVKASQRNLVHSLALSYPDIHFALLNVEGQVSPESKDFSPEHIAEEFWKLYSQDKSDWTLDADVLST